MRAILRRPAGAARELEVRLVHESGRRKRPLRRRALELPVRDRAKLAVQTENTRSSASLSPASAARKSPVTSSGPGPPKLGSMNALILSGARRAFPEKRQAGYSRPSGPRYAPVALVLAAVLALGCVLVLPPTRPASTATTRRSRSRPRRPRRPVRRPSEAPRLRSLDRRAPLRIESLSRPPASRSPNDESLQRLSRFRPPRQASPRVRPRRFSPHPRP